ncbi:MAG TPA: tetratricopeptide repeat protein [Nakamurella sp.]
MSDSVLLGDDHRRVLAGLDARVKVLMAGEDRPRVVVLLGQSGVGKSRIVRELYRWWAAHQPTPGYWPMLPEIGEAGAGSGAAALANRKVIGPPVEGFVWPAGALPAFTWWAFNCGSMTSGGAVDVVAQAKPAIQAHLRPALLAWRQSATVMQRLGRLDDTAAERLRQAISEGRNELAGQLLDAMGIVVPGLGLLFDWGHRGYKLVETRRADAKSLAGAVDLGAVVAGEQQSMSVEVANLIMAAVSPSAPAVVVVEDMHLMGEPFAEFIQVLQTHNPQRPVLVVATAWPEAHDRPVYRLWRETATAAGQLEVMDVPDLAAADLQRFVSKAAPKVAAADADRLVGHYPNPLALQLFLGLDSTRRRIKRHDGALPIGPADLAGPPREVVQDLYRKMWCELPKPVKEVLTTAAGVLPDTDLSWPFLPAIITTAGIRTGYLDQGWDAQTVEQALRAAADDHRWIVTSDPIGAYRFREAVLDDIAAESLDDYDRDELAVAAITALRRRIDTNWTGNWWIDPAVVDEQTLLIARWLWQLPPADGSVTETDVAAGHLTARTLDNVHQYAAARDLMNTRPWQNVLPPDRPAMLSIRSSNARRTGQAGRFSDAVKEIENLLIDMSRVLGPKRRSTLTNRHDLAFWRGEAGDPGGAATALEELLPDHASVFGPEHPKTLIVRSNVGYMRGRSGDPAGAVTAYEELLVDQQRVLGPDHPDTLTTKYNLAYWRGEAGDPAGAVTALEELLPDLQRVFGPEHPTTFSARSSIARWRGHAGDPAGAAAAATAYEELLVDQRRVLGPDHPGTLTTRNDLAYMRGKAGDSACAVTAYEELLVDQRRVLGPDHPDTLTTKYNLAYWRGEAGDPAGAVTALEELLPDLRLKLGPEHPTTFSARSSIARWRGEAGDPAGAVTAYKQLLVDQRRVLGPDHPGTLTTSGKLAYWLGRAGEVQ